MNIDFDTQYYAALILATTLGFNKVSELDGNYVFTSSPSSVSYSLSKVTQYQAPTPTSNIGFLGRRSRARVDNQLSLLNQYPAPDYFSTQSPIKYENVQLNACTQKQLVPFSLSLPKEDFEYFEDVENAYTNFFNKIIDLINDIKQNKVDTSSYNIANLNRLYSIAICFLNSKKNNILSTGLYEHLNNSIYNGLRYNGIEFLGSLRWLNTCHRMSSDEAKELPKLIYSTADQLVNHSQITPILFSNGYEASSNDLFRYLTLEEDFEDTKDLNARFMPDAPAIKSSLGGVIDSVKDGIEGFLNKVFPKKNKN